MRDKLSYLTLYYKGISKEAGLPNEACYTTALHMLEQRFGRKHVIAQALTINVFEGGLIRHEVDLLQTLARTMSAYLIPLSDLGEGADLNRSENLLCVVMRL